MRRLILLILPIFLGAGAAGQIQLLNPSDNGQVSLGKINGNFTFLAASKVARWSGSGAPGSFPLSVLGDFYLDVSNNLSYQCFALNACSSVAAGNWTLVGSGGSGVPGGSAGQVLWNSAGVSAGFTVSGDGTLNTSTGVVTITKTAGTSFAASATTDTTVASNISTGILPNARLASVPNSALANSSIQINTSSPLAGGATVSLGDSLTISCPTCAGGGGGTVTNSLGPLLAGQLMVGNGGVDSAVVGSLGTATTVYHGNAGGTGSFGAVSLTTDVSGILPSANGGTGNAFFGLSGPASSVKTYTLPNVSTTILTTNSPVTLGQGGTGADLSAIVKGGLIVGTAAATVAVKTVGTDGFVLTADAASTGGVKWATAAAGGTVTSIATTSPITGGTITTTGTIACATCTTAAASLTVNQILIGAGSQGMSALGSLGTTATVLHGNAGGAPAFGAVALASEVSGTLPVANGGTGNTTLTNHGVLIGAGTSAITQLAAAAAGTVLGGLGASSDPAFTATPTLGIAGSVKGTLAFAGNTSGVVTLLPQAVAGTYNFNFPTTAGTSGQFLTSAGGSSSPMTWTTVNVHVRQYGCVGNGTADDTTCFQNAINAVQGTTATLYCDGGRYKITSSLTVTAAPFNLEGAGSCEIAPSATSGTVYGLYLNFLSGANLTTVTVNVNNTSRATQSTNQVTVSSATGYSVGSEVLLTGTQNSNTFYQVTRIRSISGSIFTMWDAVGIPILTTDANSVQTMASGSNLYIGGVTFDGVGCTSTCTGFGLAAQSTRDSVYNGLRSKNWNQTNAGGMVFVYCYHCAVSNINSFNDGSAGNYAIALSGANNNLTNINIDQPAGFGLGVINGVYNNVANVSISGSVSGRGIKIASAGWSNFSNITCTNHTGANCVAISLGSWRTNWSNIIANDSAGNEGIWFSDQDNIYNTIHAAQAIGNSSRDLYVGATDSYNTIRDLSRQSVISDNGTGTVVQLEGQSSRTISVNCTGLATANTTLFLAVAPPGTCTNVSGVKPLVTTMIPYNGIIRNLRAFADVAGVDGSAGVITVGVIGPGLTTVTCTIGTGTTCQDLTHTVNVASGGLVYIQVTTRPGETLNGLVVSFEY